MSFVDKYNETAAYYVSELETDWPYRKRCSAGFCNYIPARPGVEAETP